MQDTAKILGNMIVRKMAGLLSIPYSIPCLGETAARERAKQPPVFDLGLGGTVGYGRDTLSTIPYSI